MAGLIIWAISFFMDTIKLKALVNSRTIDKKLELAKDFSLCTMLFNVEVLKHYNENFYGDEAEKGLKDYFEEAELTGRKHPLCHCAVFRGDVIPQYSLQLAPMIGLPPDIRLFAYVFAGDKDHDWTPLQADAWRLYGLAEYCFNGFVTNNWSSLLPTLIPKGYYSKTGKFIPTAQ